MTIRARFFVPAVLAVLLATAGVLLIGLTHAEASRHLTWKGLNKWQRRSISQTLASHIGAPVTRAPRAQTAPAGREGSGADGAPDTPPSSYTPATTGGASGGSAGNYFPSGQGGCPFTLGGNVKVNQNCLNLTDGDLQGRGQANNEASISQDPSNPRHIVASDNNYIRGDGSCGAHYSLDGGNTWADSIVPHSFTRGPQGGTPRQYWQAGGDTSVAWDTRGNSYLSCQVFNRGSAVDSNPDQSSGFFVYRSTQNNGASWNFPGRPVRVYYDPNGTSGVLEDKQLLTVDNGPRSPYRDRIYVTWTEFAADGTAYIYEAYSSNYGESFSNPVLVSGASAYCTNTFGVGTPQGNCNQNQFSQPFTGPDGALYVTYDNFNNQPTSGSDNRYEVLLAKSVDGGATFGAPVKVSDYYDLPDCDTYQGAGADPGRSCVPEKGAQNHSVFRATNYPSGQVDPTNPHKVVVTFGSYINRLSKESNGCTPSGFAADANPTYTGVKTPGACNNKILLSVSDNGGASFTGTAQDPRDEALVSAAPAQAGKDQFWQWSTFTPKGVLAASYYDRQYGNDETNGFSDVSLSGSADLTGFGVDRVTSGSMPPPTEFFGTTGGQFYGDYYGLTAVDGKAHPIWSDTRSASLFLCPGTAAPGKPPALCNGTEPSGQTANDQDLSSASVRIPTAKDNHGNNGNNGGNGGGGNGG